MASSNNLDALFADGELPFGHPGRRFDDTPEGFDHDHRMDQEPERDYTPDEAGDVVHYGRLPRLPGTPHRWQKPVATGLRTRCPHSPGPEPAVHQGVTADSSPKYNFRKSRFTLPVVPFYLIFRYEFSTPLYTLLPYKGRG